MSWREPYSGSATGADSAWNPPPSNDNYGGEFTHVTKRRVEPPRPNGLGTGLIVEEPLPHNALTGHHVDRPRLAQAPSFESRPGPAMAAAPGMDSTAASAMDGWTPPPPPPYLSTYQAACAGQPNEFGVQPRRGGKRCVPAAPPTRLLAPAGATTYANSDLQAGTAKASALALGSAAGHIAGYSGHVSAADPERTAITGARNPADKALLLDNFRHRGGPALGATFHHAARLAARPAAPY